ncbi:MAG: YeeE/YedE family protein, partial [Gammaproteobacteria bacterium]|nr:YeeE/YedE family protein [Gammaproteobacteria bacterium]
MSLVEIWPALAGGALIGAAAVWLLWIEGRIAGISGIVAGAMRRERGDTLWRWAFVAGLAGGALLHRSLAFPVARDLLPDSFAPALMIA